MSNATDQFVENPTLTAIAIAYSNSDHALIADQALPRTPVADQNFKYQVYDEAEMFTLPDTRVGRRSQPNQVEIDGAEKSASTEDYGIDIPLDNATIDAAKKSGYDPEKRATERSTNIVLLDREVRVAKLLTDPNNYHSDHVETLSGSDLFNDPASDPLSIIEDLMATCWVKPNQIEFGFPAWRAFRKHPKIIKAIHGNSGDQGRATLQHAAELLEVKRVLVGESRVNIKRPGENAVLQRVWGNMVCGQFIDRTADTSGGVTFGLSAQYKDKVAGTLPANMGLRGGKLIRSGESVKELIVANRAGFLIQNATSQS